MAYWKNRLDKSKLQRYHIGALDQKRHRFKEPHRNSVPLWERRLRIPTARDRQNQRPVRKPVTIHFSQCRLPLAEM